MIKNINLYLDLDGVMAGFDEHFIEYFKVNHKEELNDAQLWELINSYPDFFLNLPVMQGAKEFFSTLSAWFPDLTILTACPKTNYAIVAKQKRQWVQKHLGDYRVLPVLGGRNKALFMHKPGDVLIDDFEKNIKSWNDNNGFGILHKTPKQSLELLRSYIISRLAV